MRYLRRYIFRRALATIHAAQAAAVCPQPTYCESCRSRKMLTLVKYGVHYRYNKKMKISHRTSSTDLYPCAQHGTPTLRP
jgi:hypothetical protein